MVPTTHMSSIRKSEPHLTKKRPQRETGVKVRHIERAMSSMDESRDPVLPFEIMSNILKLGLVREDGQHVFLRPLGSSDRAYIANMSIDARTSAYNPKSNEQPPRAKHDAPAINLLMVNKSTRNESYAHLFRENTFSFSDDDHSDDVLGYLNQSNKEHIHHVAFESQWELKVELHTDMNGDIVFEFAPDWGNFVTKALSKLPNVETITLRVRCTARQGSFIRRFKGFFWKTSAGEEVWIEREKQMLEYQEVRDEIEADVANEVEAEYSDFGMERFLPMIKVAFLYSKSEEWKGDERMLLLDDIERDSERFSLRR
jgi:hypothetical protein